MKRFYILILFLIINHSFVKAQQLKFNFFTRHFFTQEEGEFQKLKKLKIKVRKLYSAYYNKEGELPSDKSLVEEIIFNDKGLPETKTNYSGQGYIRSQYIYEYNSNNDLITLEVKNSYDNIIFKKEITYNADRDTSEIVITALRRKNNEKKNFKYDDNGRLTEIIRYNYNDQIYLTEKYTYENDNLATLNIYNGDNKLYSKLNFAYNNLGNLISEERNGIIKKYTYDTQNRLVKVQTNGEIRKYKYNDRNYITDDRLFYDYTKRQYRLDFSYLKNGLADEVIRYDPDDKKIFYSKYVYN